ncbi:MAG: hypothetical protein J6E49_07315 [Acidaminococcaceae bacterium]|nr:hypothetical protein [Acidaminococcaceae bacterium]MBP3812899.1 hypothetical protein [Acidaminococcaceae bacterium]MBQ5345888.1 hypothetical protein [Acidaminococcaceae bacterium]
MAQLKKDYEVMTLEGDIVTMFFCFEKNENNKLTVAQNAEFTKNVRSVWSEEEGEMLYSVVDVIAVLTDQDYQAARNYWKVTRKRLKEEGNETVTNCNRLKMKAADGKMRLTDVSTMEQVLRIIQSIPSPKAEPFKLWLAQTGADHLQDLEAAQQLREELNNRMEARKDVRAHNRALADEAHKAGVETNQDYANFQNSGYMGLYNGEKASDIKRRKGLKKNQEILDHMGSEELGANLFRITQTEAKLRREGIKDKTAANRAHFEVGNAVRETIKSIGGTMPEDLPTPEKSIKQIESEQRKQLKKKKTILPDE